MNLKLLSYNIRFGGIGREKLLAQVIRSISPDIVVFQEATAPRVLERLSTETEMPYWGAKAAYSMGYCSRIKIVHEEWHVPRGSKHPFLEIVPTGSETRIFGLHLRALFSNWGERRRLREIRTLLKSIEKHQKGFHVVLGDFNTLGPGEVLDATKLPQWIRTMLWLSGRDIKREVVQCMLDSGYVDGFRSLHPDDMGYTFPSTSPHVRLDYVFVPASFRDHLTDCKVVFGPPSDAASDHLPLLCGLNLP